MSDNPWQGRIDSEDGEKGWRWHQKVNQQQYKISCALHGFECDLGVAQNKGRTGAVNGPLAIRKALANFAWHGQFDLFDGGNTKASENLTESQNLYGKQIQSLLDKHTFVIGLGGGHEIALGSYLGLAQANPDKNIGIINIDAHFDLRKPSPLPSSGTPFRQIHQLCEQQRIDFHYACLGVAKTANTQALFDYAHYSNTRYLLDVDCNLDNAQTLLKPMLQSIDELYVTICLDAFAANIAPGVSAPSVVGVSPIWVIKLMQWLASMKSQYSYQWRLMDIAEMNPQFDQDKMTARLAARLIDECVQANLAR